MASPETLIAPALNLAALITFLTVKLKKPVRNMVANRHVDIKKEIDAVKKDLSSARDRYEEFSGKLKAVEVETAAIREEARKSAAEVESHIKNDAKALTGIILKGSKTAAESLYSGLKSDLSSELARQVLSQAESILKQKLTGDDKKRIRQEFSSQVGKV